jgi:hypothetical protein
MKRKQVDWDQEERRAPRARKGSNKMDKHRNKIYNLFPDDYIDLEDEMDGEVYDGSKNKHKQR